MLSAEQVLDHYYLDTRCSLIEIAAMLDRYDRAQQTKREGNGKSTSDPRLSQLYRSLELLADRSTNGNRSEQLLNLFSDLD